jgi:hypothetical protein
MQGASRGLLENCRKVYIIIAVYRLSANTKAKELIDSYTLRIYKGPNR